MYVDQTVEEVEEGGQIEESEVFQDGRVEVIDESAASWAEDENKEFLVKHRRRASSGEASHSAERLTETMKTVNF